MVKYKAVHKQSKLVVLRCAAGPQRGSPTHTHPPLASRFTVSINQEEPTLSVDRPVVFFSWGRLLHNDDKNLKKTPQMICDAAEVSIVKGGLPHTALNRK